MSIPGRARWKIYDRRGERWNPGIKMIQPETAEPWDKGLSDASAAGFFIRFLILIIGILAFWTLAWLGIIK